MVRNFWPIWLMFFVFFCNIIKVKHFLCCFILLHLIYSFLHTTSLFIPYAHVSTKSTDCILLSSLELKTILLISSVKTLCLSLLNLCCVFSISLLFFYEFFLSSRRSTLTEFFEMLLNSFYNLDISVFFLGHTFLWLLVFHLHHCCL